MGFALFRSASSGSTSTRCAPLAAFARGFFPEQGWRHGQCSTPRLEALQVQRSDAHMQAWGVGLVGIEFLSEIAKVHFLVCFVGDATLFPPLSPN